ncbi:MAG: hypothetical protein A2091_12725 [Desulfuromonadales bacterium GWD2_61_12]|nr:MAG: hypothetical protein A2005_11450 [Desulfuromonadales bacterium GWC2_61_20]OGR36547.1 MAG: hypothetical protein A2091_12725 [Desulfuromonadales bacterium GWD2_61_12]HAD05060.1 hypothetical protein [Desulfuromonas sp.]HBT83961.1 hypothetical protein [Desulfuromonas sp.]
MLHDVTVPAASWFDTYAHIGSLYPYYHVRQPTAFSTGIGGILQTMSPVERKVDPLGALGFLCKGYLPGNTTMVQGIRRSPWLGAPDGNGGWRYAGVPCHGNAEREPEAVARELKAALHREMLGYVAGRKRIGLLLSGGLDSRIVAGTLRELQETGDYGGDVIAITWGLDDCRDIVYAKEIARRYDWDWVRLKLEPEQLWENIHLGARMGAEFAPFHLHAMSQVLRLDGIDAIVAGSYGDSIGRAEFSGKRVWNLKPLLTRRVDKLGLLRTAVSSGLDRALQREIYGYRAHIPDRTEAQYREIEQQLHYMRRRNQGPLALIAEHIPFFQLFTAPETCALMWSLEFKTRGDHHYARLLPTLPGKVGEIPWARNGLPLDGAPPVADQFTKLSHKYGHWLRHDLGAPMQSLLKSDALQRLNLFNPDSLKWLARIWPQATTRSVNMLDETVAWLGALALFSEEYKIQGVSIEPRRVSDAWESTRGYLYATVYQGARERLRA